MIIIIPMHNGFYSGKISQITLATKPGLVGPSKELGTALELFQAPVACSCVDDQGRQLEMNSNQKTKKYKNH